MNWLDILFLGILALCGIKGYRRGLVLQFVDLAGFILSWYLAIRWGPSLGRYLDSCFNISVFFSFEGTEALPLVEYMIIFIGVISILILSGLLFSLIGRLVRVITILPLIKPLNSLLGLPIGLLKGLLFMVIIMIILKLFPHTFIIQAGESSVIYSALDHYASLLMDWTLGLLLETLGDALLS